MTTDLDMKERIPCADMSLELIPANGGAKLLGQNSECHYLNQTAAVVWLLSDGNRTVQQIAEEVGKLFDLPEIPLEDVSAALREMNQKKILQLGSG